MLKVVSNTTPLLALLKIKKLHLLHQIYNTIYVSEAVYKEIENGATRQFYCDLKTIPWIKIEAIKDKGAKNYFLDLDEGEAETIILASELPADIVILDEIMGRRHAKRSGLTFQENGLKLPFFENFQHGFRVVAFSPESEKDIEKDIEKLTMRQREIISLIKASPRISAEELSAKVGINKRNVLLNIRKLKDAGIIQRIGPDKGGHWEIVDKQKVAKDERK
jgi:predicted nucleic acid-binding protein/biotin operon repressor